MTKKKRRRSKQQPIPTAPIVPSLISPPSKPSIFQKAKKFFTSIYGVITVVTTLAGGYLLINQFSDVFASDREKWEKSNYIKGVRIPMEVNKNIGYVTIQAGSNMCSISFERLRRGVILSGCEFFRTIPIKLKLIDDKLYTSMIFKEIKTGNVIGTMNYNKWELKNAGINHWADNENNLEVIDVNGYVVFNMTYNEDVNKVYINGYFFNNEQVGVILEDELIQYWEGQKAEAIRMIERIKPINEY